MVDKIPEQAYGFEQLDADAVCEQCGSVNPEETFICKVCGNNLRDQRARRIAGEQGVPPGVAETPINRVRLFTGLLTALGIITILAAVIFIQDIETWLASAQATEDFSDMASLWQGQSSQIFDELLA